MRIDSMPAAVQALPPLQAPEAKVPAPPTAAHAAPVPPAADFYSRRGMDYLRVPGVTSVGWGTTSAPGVYDQFHVTVADERAAAVLSGLLEPEVDGIKVVIRLGREVYDGTKEASYRDRVAAVAAMTGVWDYKYLVGPNGGRVTFNVVNQAMIDRIDPILRRDIPFGVGQQGQPTFLRVYWKAGVPA